MPNTIEINTNTNLKTNGQFAIDFQQAGYSGMIPVINGRREESLKFGYVSDTDRDACIDLITQAALATNGDVCEMRRYLMNAVSISAAGIKPDEAVDVDGTEMLVSYNDKAIYLGTEKIADLEDIESNIGNEATKLLLIERAKNVMQARQIEEDEFAHDFWDDIE